MVSKKEVSRCGTILVTGNPGTPEHERALDVLEIWRDAHQYPMEQIELAVRDASKDVEGVLSASRLKRRDTIVGKLARPDTYYTLQNLDDIAGCRCIVPTIGDVQTISERLRRHDGYKRDKDYIASPKPSGYRGVHLFHRCDSPEFGYENLRIETQVRTYCQHAWATAVELFDVINDSKMKFGFGEEIPTRAFVLMSNLLAIHEGCALVPGAPSDAEETVQELIQIEAERRIVPSLAAFSCSVNAIESSMDVEDAQYYLLEFNYIDQMVTITAFSGVAKEEAVSVYSEKERKKADETDVLLVKADSIEGLKEAYPNYFSDITRFLRLMNMLTGNRIS